MEIVLEVWYNIFTGGSERMARNTYEIIMSGISDNNIRFTDVRILLVSMGFKERIKGDHFIYKNPSLPERINIQPNGNKAKAYQIKQIRMIFNKYGL